MILSSNPLQFGTPMNQSQQLLDISTNALLHLEFKKLDKRLTQTEQNNLLVQYLKKSSRMINIVRLRNRRKVGYCAVEK